MEFGVLGFGVWGLWFGVCGLGFRVKGVGCRVGVELSVAHEPACVPAHVLHGVVFVHDGAGLPTLAETPWYRV